MKSNLTSAENPNSTVELKDSVIQEIDRVVEGHLIEKKYPGISFGVLHSGNLLYANSFGRADVRRNISLDWRKHRFAAGSISKVFTTFAIYHLIETTPDVDLDSNVVELLPWLHRGRSDLGDIKIRHLLSHLSGLQRSVGGTTISDIEHFSRGIYSPPYEHFENIFLKAERRYSKAGVLPQYSNLAYSLMGRLLIEVAERNGYPFTPGTMEEKVAEYIRNEVIRPMGLKDYVDFFLPGAHRQYDVTQYSGGFSGPDELSSEAFRYEIPPIVSPGIALTHSGINSSVVGLAGLARNIDLMMQGRFEHGVFKEKSFREMTKLVTRNISDKKEGANLGYGTGAFLYERLQLANEDEIVVVGHTGTAIGSRSLMYIEPVTGLGVVLMLNEGLADRHLFAKSIFSIVHPIFKDHPRTLSKEYRKTFDDAVEKLNEEISLTEEHIEVMPQKGEKLTVGALKKSFLEAEKLEPIMVDRAIQSLLFRKFEGLGIGGQVDRQFLFVDSSGEIQNFAADDFEIRFKTGNGEAQELTLDRHPMTGETILRMPYTPVFVAFPFMFVSLELGVDGEVNAISLDHSFRHRAVRPGQRTYPGIPTVKRSEF